MVCRLGPSQEWRYTALLPEWQPGAPRRLRTPHGLQLEEDGLRRGGGIPNGRKLKAVVPGGSSTPCLTAEEIDISMDFDSLAKAGSMLGSGGVVVLDDATCIVKFALRTMKFYQHESCGWCIP